MKGDRTETTETFVYSALFMERKRRGIGSAILGGTIFGTVMINARLAISNVYASKRMNMDEFLFTWKDPFGNKQSRTDIVEVFEHDFVVYLTKIQRNVNGQN